VKVGDRVEEKQEQQKENVDHSDTGFGKKKGWGHYSERHTEKYRQRLFEDDWGAKRRRDLTKRSRKGKQPRVQVPGNRPKKTFEGEHPDGKKSPRGGDVQRRVTAVGIRRNPRRKCKTEQPWKDAKNRAKGGDQKTRKGKQREQRRGTKRGKKTGRSQMLYEGRGATETSRDRKKKKNRLRGKKGKSKGAGLRFWAGE